MAKSPQIGLSDFSDRLSPMLVKELRQGMRTRVFTALFLVFQVLLAFFVLTALASGADSNLGDQVTSLIIGFFALVALAIQPVRGISAISTEMREQTIDLMVLTKLDSWRIVFGKWASLVTQTTLLFATTVPYLVMRYFFGGMELVTEVAILVSILIASGGLTAITVGLSANKSPLIRGLIPLMAAPAGFYIVAILIFNDGFRSLQRAFSFDSFSESVPLIVALLAFVYIGYFFLEMGATRIATSVENRATKKRLVGLVAVLLCGSFAFGTHDQEVGYIIALCLTSLLALDVLTESPPLLSKVYEPFLRRGHLGRIAAAFLAPGWHTGVLFLMLIFTLTGVYAYFFNTSSDGYEIITVHLGWFYSLLAPLLVIQMFRKKITNPFAIYLVVLVSSGILISLLTILSGAFSDTTIALLGSFIPGMFFFVLDNAYTIELSAAAAIYAFYLASTLVILSPQIIRQFRTKLIGPRN